MKRLAPNSLLPRLEPSFSEAALAANAATAAAAAASEFQILRVGMIARMRRRWLGRLCSGILYLVLMLSAATASSRPATARARWKRSIGAPSLALDDDFIKFVGGIGHRAS